MQKYLLFLFVFIVSSFVATSVGSSGSPQVKDFLWFHPQNTTVDGLVEIADNVIKKNLLVDEKELLCNG